MIGEAPTTDDPLAATETLIAAASEATGVSYDFVLKEGGNTFVVGDAIDNTFEITGDGAPVAYGFKGKDTIVGSAAGDLNFGGRGDDALSGMEGMTRL